MSIRTRLKILSALIVAIGVPLSILGASEFVDFLSVGWLPVRKILIAVSGSILVLIVGMALWIAFSRTQESITGRISSRTNLSHRLCRPDDIPKVAALASDVFGPRSTSVEETRRLYDMDPKTFTVITNANGRIEGYLCIIRLTSPGVKALERNDFTIRNVAREYVMKSGGKATYNNLYIGAVYGKGKLARGYAMGVVSEQLTSARPVKVYARAISDDGLTTLRNKDFKPLPGRPDAIGEIFVRAGFKTIRYAGRGPRLG